MTMNSQTLRRIGIIGLILTVLVGLDSIYMFATNYKPDDAGSNTLHMTDGTTVLIAAILLLIISIAAFALSRQTARQEAIAGTTTTDTVGATPTTTETPATTETASETVSDETNVENTASPEIQR